MLAHRYSLLALAVLLGTFAWMATLAHALGHPPVLDPEAGCERWLGGANGNDRSVRLNLKLCPDGSGVRGQMQWSSTVSGWNLREVAGRWEADALSLSDVRITAERPQPGWRFCTVDLWSLARRGERLEGRYDSAACNDHASVWFERMADEPSPTPPASHEPTKGPSDPTRAGQGTGSTPVGPPATTTTSDVPTPPVQQPPPSEAGGCACTVVGTDRTGGARRGATHGLGMLLSITFGVRSARMRARARSRSR